MLDVQTLKDAFADKLHTTSSLDAAFTKAVWTAYKQGVEDGASYKAGEDTTVIPDE